ncbi:PKD domain-containing protein [Lentzea sp. NPDC054927]
MITDVRRTRILVAVAAVASVTAAALVAGQGYDAARVRMFSGAAWLASNQTGAASLVDGATGEVRTHVPVARPGAVLNISQQDGAAFVANRMTGQLSRVDSATEKVVPSGADLPASTGLVVRSSPDAVYGVDVQSGQIAAVNRDTMRSSGDRTRLAERLEPDSAVVDGDGRLWAVAAETGDLVWLEEGQRRSRPAGARNGRLTVTGGRPALVDPARGTAELLHPGTGVVAGTVRPNLGSGDVVTVGGSADRPRVLIANSTRGQLVVCAFDTRSCAEPVQISAPGADLGTPIEIDDHAVVPDRSAGQATIVDLSGTRVISQRQLFDGPARFELLVRDGFVFFNDPESNRAGTLSLTGEVRTITKYTADGTPPGKPDPQGQADQPTKAVQQEQKPGLSLPGQNSRPTQPFPTPPVSAMSIVVKPGSRGEAGTGFELTAVFQPATAATVRWSFGDGAEAEGTTVGHTWTRPGAFTVQATATTSVGKQLSARTTVTVDPAGAPPRITRLSVQRPKPVIGELVHIGADTSGQPDSWAWTITKPGQHTPEATGKTAEFGHRFTTPGRYTVSLTITKGIRTATSSRELTVALGAVKGWGASWGGVQHPPPAAASGVIAIDAGSNHGLALKADGSVIAWGDNEFGQLNVPPAATSGVIGISAGGDFSLALKADGSVVAWGSNDFGQATVPPAAAGDVIAIAAGYLHSLALKKDGSVIAWGPTSGATTVPPAAQSGVIAISGGGGHSMALKADGSVVVWADEVSWGNPNLRIPPEAGAGVIAISAEYESSLALRSDGSVVFWGNDDGGLLALPPEARSSVIAVDTFVQLSMALKSDGTVVVWGETGLGSVTVPPEYNSGVLGIATGWLVCLVVV